MDYGCLWGGCIFNNEAAVVEIVQVAATVTTILEVHTI